MGQMIERNRKRSDCEEAAAHRPLMEFQVGQNKLAGLIALVARRGKVVHAECRGRMDAEAKRPMTEDTISASIR